MATLNVEDLLDDADDESIVVAFDLYGTLVNTSSISKKLAEYVQDKADAVSTTFRKYQLEYTWRLNSMGTYEPFDAVTKKALIHALKEHNVSLPSAKITAIMTAYDSLESFPDVAETIDKLRSNNHIRPLIFSNGTHAMTSALVKNVSEINAFEQIPEPLCVVHDMEKYKPHPMVYEYLAAKVGKGIQGVGEIVLVSSNPFDICGAAEVGLKTCWVDRQGTGWQDGLGSPTYMVKSLVEVSAIVENLLKEQGWGQPKQNEQ